MQTVPETRLYRIRVEAPAHDFLSEGVFTKEQARTEIKRRRAEGGWDRCRFFICPADLYAMPAGGAP